MNCEFALEVIEITLIAMSHLRHILAAILRTHVKTSLIWVAKQPLNVSMDTMDTVGHYRLYVALLQSPVDSPGFADVMSHES